MITNIERIQKLKLSCTLNDNGRERHFHRGHEYIEIDGIKWATMNIGANSVADYNCLYFQWGDTKGYTASQVGVDNTFDWEDYKYGNGTSDPIYTDMTKYNDSDGKTVLDFEDDAARANWGGNWRMPTTEEIQALGFAVNTEWTNDYQSSGIKGLVCTAKGGSGAQLFFPAVGFCSKGYVNNVGKEGNYWSSSLYGACPSDAWSLYIKSGIKSARAGWPYIYYRRYGFAIRGVVG